MQTINELLQEVDVAPNNFTKEVVGLLKKNLDKYETLLMKNLQFALDQVEKGEFDVGIEDIDEIVLNFKNMKIQVCQEGWSSSHKVVDTLGNTVTVPEKEVERVTVTTSQPDKSDPRKHVHFLDTQNEDELYVRSRVKEVYLNTHVMDPNDSSRDMYSVNMNVDTKGDDFPDFCKLAPRASYAEAWKDARDLLFLIWDEKTQRVDKEVDIRDANSVGEVLEKFSRNKPVTARNIETGETMALQEGGTWSTAENKISIDYERQVKSLIPGACLIEFTVTSTRQTQYAVHVGFENVLSSGHTPKRYHERDAWIDAFNFYFFITYRTYGKEDLKGITEQDIDFDGMLAHRLQLEKILGGVEKDQSEDRWAGSKVGERTQEPRWEIAPRYENPEDHSSQVVGWCVRWSEPNEKGEYLWVRHYIKGSNAEKGLSLEWCENAAERDAQEFNSIGRLPGEWEGRGFGKGQPVQEKVESESPVSFQEKKPLHPFERTILRVAQDADETEFDILFKECGHYHHVSSAMGGNQPDLKVGKTFSCPLCFHEFKKREGSEV